MILWKKFSRKRYFLSKTKKNKDHHSIVHIGITKFQFTLTILIFWTKFTQKMYSQPKAEKLISTIEFCIFQLVQVSHFTLNKKFWILGLIFPKRVFPDKNGRGKHHHWFLHIQIILGTRFQLKLTILIFRTRFAPKNKFLA